MSLETLEEDEDCEIDSLVQLRLMEDVGDENRELCLWMGGRGQVFGTRK